MTEPGRPTRRSALAAIATAFLAACTRTGRRTPWAVGTAADSAAGSAPVGSGSAGPGQPASALPSTPARVAAPANSRTPAAGNARPRGPARFVAAGPRSGTAVALTFHGAGDPAIAESLMRTAEAAGAALTVFAVGQWLAAQPQLAARIARGGHELANHTWSHPSLGRLGSARVDAEIKRCRDEIDRHGGTHRWFRPSAMRVPTALVLARAGAAGYRTVVGFDVDTLDFTDPGAAAIRRAARSARAGSIVSLHFGHPGTVAALPAILADLKSRGLTAVTVSALLPT